MGGNQSTRRLTLVNDDKAGIIKVSDSLAHRLKGQLEDAASSKAEPPPETPPPKQTAKPPPPPPSNTHTSSKPLSSPVNPWPGIPPEEAKRALGRLQQEQEAAISSVEDTWKTKMLEREKEFVQTTALLVSEAQKTADEVEAAFSRNHQQLGNHCSAAEQAVIDCYKQNPKQSLVCADAVKDLMRCVDLPSLDSLEEGKA